MLFESESAHQVHLKDNVPLHFPRPQPPTAPITLTSAISNKQLASSVDIRLCIFEMYVCMYWARMYIYYKTAVGLWCYWKLSRFTQYFALATTISALTGTPKSKFSPFFSWLGLRSRVKFFFYVYFDHFYL